MPSTQIMPLRCLPYTMEREKKKRKERRYSTCKNVRENVQEEDSKLSNKGPTHIQMELQMLAQMDDLGYMCSLENPGLEPLLTEQANVS